MEIKKIIIKNKKVYGANNHYLGVLTKELSNKYGYKDNSIEYFSGGSINCGRFRSFISELNYRKLYEQELNHTKPFI